MVNNLSVEAQNEVMPPIDFLINLLITSSILGDQMMNVNELFKETNFSSILYLAVNETVYSTDCTSLILFYFGFLIKTIFFSLRK